MIVWALQTKRLVIVVFCSVCVMRGGRPQEQETTTATTFFFHSSQRALEDWTTAARWPASHQITHKKKSHLFIFFSFYITRVWFFFLPRGFFSWTLIVDWKGCIYVNYHLLFECALNPQVLSRLDSSSHVGGQKKEPLKGIMLCLQNKKGMYILKRTYCVFLAYYKFIMSVWISL